MFTALAIGDLHSKISNQDELLKCTDFVSEQIQQHSPDIVVVLGDLANDHERMAVQAFNGIVNFLHKTVSASRSVGAQTIYLVGNHDLCNNQQFQTTNHFFNSFKLWPDLKIIDSAEAITVERHTILACPYVPVGRFSEALLSSGVNLASVSAVFCHQEFFGSKIGNLQSKNGDKWPAGNPVIVSGHIHTYDRPQSNILYPGAPMFHTFGEEGDKSISFLCFDGKSFTEERVYTNCTHKITINLSVEDAINYVPPDGAHVRLNISGTTESFIKFKKSKKFAELNEKTKIVPHIVDPVKIKHGTANKNYIDILKERCAKESNPVQDACAEVVNEINAD